MKASKASVWKKVIFLKMQTPLSNRQIQQFSSFYFLQ